MTTFSPGMDVAAAAGCAVVLWPVLMTAWRYRTLPARVRYPKNYDDGGEQLMPKLVVWLMPAVQIAAAAIIAWAVSLRLANAPGTHGDPLTALIIADVLLFVLFLVQRNIMLKAGLADVQFGGRDA